MNSLAPSYIVLFLHKQPFHQRIPRIKKITQSMEATIPITTPAEIFLPPSEGGVKSAQRKKKIYFFQMKLFK